MLLDFIRAFVTKALQITISNKGNVRQLTLALAYFWQLASLVSLERTATAHVCVWTPKPPATLSQDVMIVTLDTQEETALWIWMSVKKMRMCVAIILTVITPLGRMSVHVNMATRGSLTNVNVSVCIGICFWVFS